MTFWQFRGRENTGNLSMIGAGLVLLAFLFAQFVVPTPVVKPGLSGVFRVEYIVFAVGVILTLRSLWQKFSGNEPSVPWAISILGLWVAAIPVSHPFVFVDTGNGQVVMVLMLIVGLVLTQAHWLIPTEVAWREHCKANGDTSGAKQSQAAVTALSNHRPGH